MPADSNHEKMMRKALELATTGEGWVEPNPMVGCVIVKDNEVISTGFHQKFGGNHAEVNAIQSASCDLAGATAYVTLEPCCHDGKTPACTQALIDAGISQVFVATLDPFEKVSGQGVKQLIQAGIEISTGLLEDKARELNAPFFKRVTQGLPWMIAKWAMTWDGKIATTKGDSQWISNESSRKIVHELRGRVDGIMIGSGTATADDPLLTARPAGQRIATRIVVDSTAQISTDSQLVKTADQFPVLIAVGPEAPQEKIVQLRNLNCQIWQSLSVDRADRLMDLQTYLAGQGMTNILVEGGSQLLGSLRNLQTIDEVHLFLGPKLFGGGATSLGPIGTPGIELVKQADEFQIRSLHQLDNDVYVVGRRNDRRNQ